MCGTIRTATSSEQAADYSLAYAKWYTETADGADELRRQAQFFINNYVPYDLRNATKTNIAARDDASLTTNLDYFTDVVD